VEVLVVERVEILAGLAAALMEIPQQLFLRKATMEVAGKSKR
jgi:hypothetical protein